MRMQKVRTKIEGVHDVSSPLSYPNVVDNYPIIEYKKDYKSKSNFT